jgi:hypothetical protein
MISKPLSFLAAGIAIGNITHAESQSQYKPNWTKVSQSFKRFFLNMFFYELAPS